MGIAVSVGKVDILPLLNGDIFPKCNVLSVCGLNGIAAEDAVLVIGEGAEIFTEEISAVSVIVNADEQISSRRWQGLSVITCGISGKNTVSVTSKTTDRITLSLNRSIHTLKGLCEPLEYPVPLIDGIDDYDYMAAFAVSLLLGNIE